jgi:transposase
MTYSQVAEILMLDETTIRRYEKQYKKNGVDGLLEDHYHGSAGLLTREQETELTDYLKTRLYQTAKEVFPIYSKDI